MLRFQKDKTKKFMNMRVLKSKETTTVSENENFKIPVSDDEFSASSNKKNVKPKVISIDLKKQPQTDLCFVCNPPLKY